MLLSAARAERAGSRVMRAGGPCGEGGGPCGEGGGPCGEGGGEPKAVRMFSNGSLHSGGSRGLKNPSPSMYSPTRPSFSGRFSGSVRFTVTHSSPKTLNRSPSEIFMFIKPKFSSSPSILASNFQFSKLIWGFSSAFADFWAWPKWASAHRACACRG